MHVENVIGITATLLLILPMLLLRLELLRSAAGDSFKNSVSSLSPFFPSLRPPCLGAMFVENPLSYGQIAGLHITIFDAGRSEYEIYGHHS